MNYTVETFGNTCQVLYPLVCAVSGLGIAVSHLVNVFPYFVKTNGGLEAVAYHQRHCCVRDDIPGPHPIKLRVQRVELRLAALQPVHHPHGQICNQQKRDELFPWFLLNLFLRVTSPLPRVQH